MLNLTELMDIGCAHTVVDSDGWMYPCGKPIVDGERIASGGDAKWLRPLAAMLAARIPFVSGSVESGLSVDITSSEFLDCCRSVWIGADTHRGFGRYLNLRWDVGRREWVEVFMVK